MNDYGNYQSSEEIEIDLFQLCKYVFKHAILIIIATVIGAGLGAGFAVVKNKGVAEMYKSSAAIYCEPAIRNEANGGTDLNAQKEMLNDYALFAVSRPVLETTVKDLNLDINAEDLASSVETEVVKDTRVLKIDATADSPEKAQAIAGLLADTTVEQIKSKSSFSDPYILEPANLPAAPDAASGKSVGKTALIGAVLGFFVICGIYACIYVFGDKIMNEDDVKRFLRMMTIAEVKKGEDIEQYYSRLREELDFDTIQLGKDQSLIDEFIKVTEVSKTGKIVIPVMPVGAHARLIRKSLEKLSAAECKIPGVILTEA